MRVYKFGGASVKDAESVKNVHRIIESSAGGNLIVVISAMGKTTNKFEALLDAHFEEKPTKDLLESIRAEHVKIASDLFGEKAKKVIDDINNTLVEVEWALDDPDGLDKHFQYDQIVSIGEMLSTKIVSAFLNSEGAANSWVDARDLIRTDNTYQDAKVDWNETHKLTSGTIERALKKAPIVVTQGFIGGTSENFTTTLGREGSDFTAAILAHCVSAKDVTIWKDVPGVLNADPKYFENTELIPEMSYFDAMELAYFGTSVIHPKTIKPLQNAGIPLHVKSFVSPAKSGTIVTDSANSETVPSFIVKQNQALVSISPTDHSFVAENHFIEVFSVLNELRIKSNVMQNSAISFSFCMDFDESKLKQLSNQLGAEFEVKYNEGCELITVRHFNEETISKLVNGRQILLEQRTRTSAQLVVSF
ncbi:MAG: aspartate kinase [Flavobacteriales bacterium]